MICQKIDFASPLILQVYALRQKELRTPLGLNLFNEDLLGEQHELFFVGVKANQVVSTLQLKIIDQTVLKLRQMTTDSKSQGNGFGKQLVQFAEAWALQLGYGTIELHARQEARGFYEKMGYKKVGNQFLEVEIPHYKMAKQLDQKKRLDFTIHNP